MAADDEEDAQQDEIPASGVSSSAFEIEDASQLMKSSASEVSQEVDMAASGSGSQVVADSQSDIPITTDSPRYDTIL